MILLPRSSQGARAGGHTQMAVVAAVVEHAAEEMKGKRPVSLL